MTIAMFIKLLFKDTDSKNQHEYIPKTAPRVLRHMPKSENEWLPKSEMDTYQILRMTGSKNKG